MGDEGPSKDENSLAKVGYRASSHIAYDFPLALPALTAPGLDWRSQERREWLASLAPEQLDQLRAYAWDRLLRARKVEVDGKVRDTAGRTCIVPARLPLCSRPPRRPPAHQPPPACTAANVPPRDDGRGEAAAARV